MLLGKLIRKGREKRKLSLSKLAAIIGITKSHLWCIEKGRTVNIGLLVAAELSEELNIPISEMVKAALEDSANG